MTCETDIEIFEYVQNDTWPLIVGTYVDEDGEAIPITGWTIELLVDMTVPITVTGTVTDGPAGEWQIQFATTDLSEVGQFVTALRFTDDVVAPDTGIVSYQGYFKIKVIEKIA